jgi:hypothetical protein
VKQLRFGYDRLGVRLNFKRIPERPSQSSIISSTPGKIKRTILLISVMVFTTLPILWFSHLPLVDYPNHLARLQIHKTLSTNIYLARFYEFHWQFTPYLGLDLLAQPLLPFLPVELTGRLVVIFTFLMIYSGTMLLNRELNNEDWGPSIFAGVFLYNSAFEWGFINYIIGVGYAVWAFWAWVRYRENNIVISIIVICSSRRRGVPHAFVRFRNL